MQQQNTVVANHGSPSSLKFCVTERIREDHNDNLKRQPFDETGLREDVLDTNTQHYDTMQGVDDNF